MTHDEFLERLQGNLPRIHSMGMMLFDPVWAQKMHPSGSCEILHVIRGTLSMEYPDEPTVVAGPGETVLHPGRKRHRDSFDLDEGLEVFFCSFSWEWAEEYFARVPRDFLAGMPSHVKTEISVSVNRLCVDVRKADDSTRLLAESRLLTVLLLILREALHSEAGEGDDGAATYGAQRREQLMEQAREYLEAHLAECIALDDVAAALDISPYYLSHLFSEENNLSLFSYLTLLRMEKAKALLLGGEKNISEVAYAVGYNSPNYFSKVFKRHFDRSPRDFLTAGES